MSKTSAPIFSLALLHPRYWLTWVGFGLWIVVSQLPFTVLLLFGRGLGLCIYLFATRRRAIAARNLELCFPEKTATQRRRLVRAHFVALGISIFETGMVWFGAGNKLQNKIHYQGLATLQQSIKDNEGVLLIALHFTTLELLGYGMNSVVDNIHMSYRPHNNPVYDWLQSRARARHNPDSAVVAARDIREIVRALKGGRRISFLPDQDYGRKHSIFVPFFNIPTATVVTLSRLARLSGARVVPLMSQRLPGNAGYRITIHAPWENFPSNDDYADAARVNRYVEQCIQQAPEQFLWTHRRFKTRPSPDEDLYQLPQSRAKARRQQRKRRQREKMSSTH